MLQNCCTEHVELIFARPTALSTPYPTVKKLSVIMPASLHLRAKRYALVNDQTLTELVISKLEEFLDGAEGPKLNQDKPA
jgi:hypothetical protein